MKKKKHDEAGSSCKKEKLWLFFTPSPGEFNHIRGGPKEGRSPACVLDLVPVGFLCRTGNILPCLQQWTNWHHVVQVPLGMSVSQHGVLPLGHVPKPSTGHLFHGVAHGDADLQKCPVSTCLHHLPGLMLKPTAMPAAVGSCQRSVLPSDLGACSRQDLSTMWDPSLTGHAPPPHRGTRVASSSPSRSVHGPGVLQVLGKLGPTATGTCWD